MKLIKDLQKYVVYTFYIELAHRHTVVIHMLMELISIWHHDNLDNP